MKRHPVFLIYFFILLMGATACRYPRCPSASCHIRMKHRHDSGGTPVGFDPNAELTAGSMQGRGKIYRGVPWYERNKDPKIAQGYKPGRKYRHRKEKLDAKKLKKLEDGKRAKEAEEKPDKVPAEAAPGMQPQEGSQPPETKEEKKRKRKKKADKSNEIEIIEAPKKETKKPVETEEKKDGF